MEEREEPQPTNPQRYVGMSTREPGWGGLLVSVTGRQVGTISPKEFKDRQTLHRQALSSTSTNEAGEIIQFHAPVREEQLVAA